MQLFPLSAITLHSGYLYEKQELNRRVTMSAVYDRFSETGRISPFEHAWKEGDPNKSHIFFDSDVANRWSCLRHHPESSAPKSSLIHRLNSLFKHPTAKYDIIRLSRYGLCRTHRAFGAWPPPVSINRLGGLLWQI